MRDPKSGGVRSARLSEHVRKDKFAGPKLGRALVGNGLSLAT
jgi:hypothetical protein